MESYRVMWCEYFHFTPREENLIASSAVVVTQLDARESWFVDRTQQFQNFPNGLHPETSFIELNGFTWFTEFLTRRDQDDSVLWSLRQNSDVS